jgi:hypothetical protein
VLVLRGKKSTLIFPEKSGEIIAAQIVRVDMFARRDGARRGADRHPAAILCPMGSAVEAAMAVPAMTTRSPTASGAMTVRTLSSA